MKLQFRLFGSFFILSFLFLANLNAQNFGYDWHHRTAYNSSISYSDLLSDSSGNTYVVGSFSGTIDFDPGPTVQNKSSNGGKDIFLMKLDESGQLIWVKTIGGSGNDFGTRIIRDNSGNILITGHYQDSVDFDPGSGYSVAVAVGNMDIYLVRFSSNGGFLGLASFPAFSLSNLMDLESDVNGFTYLCGSFRDSMDTDPGVSNQIFTSPGRYNGFVIKLDTSLDFLWSKQLGSDIPYTVEAVNAIDSDTSGNIYLAGNFRDTLFVSIGNQTAHIISNGSSNSYIYKVAGNGDGIWIKQFSSHHYGASSNITDLNYVAGRGIHIIGHATDSLDLDPAPGTSYYLAPHVGNKFDMFLLNLTDAGDFYNAVQFRGIYFNPNQRLSVTQNNEVLITCTFSDSLNINPNNPNQWVSADSSTIGLLIRLDSGYNLKNHLILEHNSNYSFIDGELATDGIRVIGARSGLWVDIDPAISNSIQLNSTNGSVGYIVKYNECNPDTAYITKTACDSFLWLDNNYYSSDTSGLIGYTRTSLGCDSVVYINLTIEQSNHVTVNYSACDSFQWIDGKTYYSSNNTAIHSYSISNACDSVVHLNLIIHYPDTSMDSVYACDAYTWIDGNTYTSDTSGVSHTLQNQFGCDSIVYLSLYVSYSDSIVQTFQQCDTFTWIDGKTYSFDTSGVSYTLQNSQGCDSVLWLNLNIFHSDTTYDSLTVCDGLTWIDGQTYSQDTSGVVFHYTNQYGCDSAVVLNLSVNNSSSSTHTVSACNQYTWINGITYDSSNFTASHVLVNAQGCDSTIYLNLIIHSSDSIIDNVTACDSFTWINGQTYYSSNSFQIMDSLVNRFGCDSIVWLNLTIHSSHYQKTDTSSCDSFSWHGMIFYSDIDTSLTYIGSAGCDSVYHLVLDIRNSSYRVDSVTSCAPFTWVDGKAYSTDTSGAYYIIPNSEGCDSIAVLTFHYEPLGVSVYQSGTTLHTPTVAQAYQWLTCVNNVLTPIQGANANSLQVSQNGDYAVAIRVNNCYDTSSCFNVTGIGWKTLSHENGVKVYPNPSNGIIHIHIDKAPEAYIIRLLDASGREVKHCQGSGSDFDWNPEIIPGMYWLIIESEQGLYRLKISRIP